MRNISRRTALKGGTAALAAIAGAGAVAARVAVENPDAELLMDLWRKRTELWRRADCLNEESTRLKATLPAWVKELPRVEVDFHGRKFRVCHTADEVKAAMFFTGVPAYLIGDSIRWKQYCDKILQYQSDKIEELMVQEQRQAEARKEAGLTAINEEIDNVGYEATEVEGQICEAQASTLQGFAVQALMFEDLERDSPPEHFSTQLAKSMGAAARKLVPELREARS